MHYCITIKFFAFHKFASRKNDVGLNCFSSCSLKIEENKQRLDDLRKIAAEKAEIEWKEKKERMEKQQTEERDLEEKRKRLEEMRKEQELAAEKERYLIQEEADKIRKHEEFLTVSLSLMFFWRSGCSFEGLKLSTLQQRSNEMYFRRLSEDSLWVWRVILL